MTRAILIMAVALFVGVWAPPAGAQTDDVARWIANAVGDSTIAVHIAPSPGQGVTEGTLVIAGHRLRFRQYATARGGAQSTGVEGFYVYIDLGRVPFTTFVPPGVPGRQFLPATSMPALVVLSESSNRVIPRAVLPEPIREWTDRVYAGRADYTIVYNDMASVLTSVDLAAAPGMAQAFTLFGLGSTVRPVTASSAYKAIVAVLRGNPPASAVTFVSPIEHAPNVPGFTGWTKFSNWMVGVAVQPGTGAKVAYTLYGDLDVTLGGRTLPFSAVVSENLPATGTPYLQLVGAYREAVPVTGLFGQGWLTIRNPIFGVTFPATGTEMMLSGTADLGGKSFDLTAGSKLAGPLPLPVLKFKTDSLALTDLARIGNAVITARPGVTPSTTGPLPITALPQVELRNPYFVYVPPGAADPSFNVYSSGLLVKGEMYVLGAAVGMSETQIDFGGVTSRMTAAQPGGVRFGPVGLPAGSLEVDVRVTPAGAVSGGASARLKAKGVNAMALGSSVAATMDVAWNRATLTIGNTSLLGGLVSGALSFEAAVRNGSILPDEKWVARVKLSDAMLDRFTVNLGAGLKFLAQAEQAAFQRATNNMHRYTEDLRQAELHVLDVIKAEDAIIDQAKGLIRRAQDVVNAANSRANDVCGHIHWYDAGWKGPECGVLKVAAAAAKVALDAAHVVADPIINAAQRTVDQAVAQANTLIQKASAGIDAAVTDFDAVLARGQQALLVGASMAALELDRLTTVFKVTDATVTLEGWSAAGAAIAFDYILLGQKGNASATFALTASFPDLHAQARAGGGGAPPSVTYDPTGQTLRADIKTVAERVMTKAPTRPLGAQDFRALRDSDFCAKYTRADIGQLEYAEGLRAEAQRYTRSPEPLLEAGFLVLAADALEKSVIVKQYGAAAVLAWRALLQAPLTICDPGFTAASVAHVKQAHTNATVRRADLEKLLQAQVTQVIPATDYVVLMPFYGQANQANLVRTPRAWAGRPHFQCVNTDSFRGVSCDARPVAARLLIKPTAAGQRPIFNIFASDARCWQTGPHGGAIGVAVCNGSPGQQFVNMFGQIFVAGTSACLTVDASTGAASFATCRGGPSTRFAIVPVAAKSACSQMAPPAVGRTTASVAGRQFPVEPLYRYYFPATGRHFFTKHWGELGGCFFAGIAGYVFEVDRHTAATYGFQPLARFAVNDTADRTAGTYAYNGRLAPVTETGRVLGVSFNLRTSDGWVSAYHRPGLAALYAYTLPLVTTDFNELGGAGLIGIAGWIVTPEDQTTQPVQTSLPCTAQDPPATIEPFLHNGVFAVPLLRHAVRGKHLYTGDWRERGSCGFEKAEGYVVSPLWAIAPAGTAALRRYYLAHIDDHYYTTQAPNPLPGDWYTQEPVGYIYTMQVSGTVPLHEYNLSRMHFYTTEYHGDRLPLLREVGYVLSR